MMEKNDHDLLIELNTKVDIFTDIFTKGFENHLAHHNRWMITMLSITITAVVTALTSVFGFILLWLKSGIS